MLKLSIVERDAQLNKVVTDMETSGMWLDLDQLSQVTLKNESRAAELIEEISTLAGREYKAGPNWLKKYFGDNKIKYRLNPETGNPVFGKEGLEHIDNPVAKKILEYNNTVHHISHFLYGIDNVRVGAKLYPYIRPYGTASGRMTYNTPNIHSMPEEFQPIILPPPGHTLVSLDYSQQEMCLLFDYAGDLEMIRKINFSGVDVHTLTAESLNISRTMAKTINFALIYGLGIRGLAQKLGTSMDEASNIKAQYFRRFPRVEKFLYEVASKARRTGFVTNWMGRKLVLDSRDKDYTMVNYLLQSSGADILKNAMVEIYNDFSEVSIYATIHDAILIVYPDTDAGNYCMGMVKKIMEDTYLPLNGIKLKVDVKEYKYGWGTSE